MSAAGARWLAVKSMAAAAISINTDLRIAVPHLLQIGTLPCTSVQDYGKILKHGDIANKL